MSDDELNKLLTHVRAWANDDDEHYTDYSVDIPDLLCLIYEVQEWRKQSAACVESPASTKPVLSFVPIANEQCGNSYEPFFNGVKYICNKRMEHTDACFSLQRVGAHE